MLAAENNKRAGVQSNGHAVASADLTATSQASCRHCRFMFVCVRQQPKRLAQMWVEKQSTKCDWRDLASSCSTQCSYHELAWLLKQPACRV